MPATGQQDSAVGESDAHVACTVLQEICLNRAHLRDRIPDFTGFDRDGEEQLSLCAPSDKDLSIQECVHRRQDSPVVDGSLVDEPEGFVKQFPSELGLGLERVGAIGSPDDEGFTAIEQGSAVAETIREHQLRGTE